MQEKRFLNLNFDEITNKLEHAFDVTQIPKADTCVLWANLSSSLFYNPTEDQIAYPLYGTLTFENKQTKETGRYDSSNQSFHMATLYYSNNIWYLLDFSTNYLISDNFNIVSLHDCPIRVEVPELAHIGFKETTKIEDTLKLISKISIETNDYNYCLISKSIHYMPNDENYQELDRLENVLYG